MHSDHGDDVEQQQRQHGREVDVVTSSKPIAAENEDATTTVPSTVTPARMKRSDSDKRVILFQELPDKVGPWSPEKYTDIGWTHD